MASGLSALHFHDEDAAFAYVEARVWPSGAICPHCGGVERISKMQGKSTRKGLYKCYQCRKPFTVRMGTVFEASHVPLHIWLQAMYLIAGSKKGISSNQLHRTLGVTLKAAWFMSHRIREAMRSNDLTPLGGDGGVVEVDETYIGNKKSVAPGHGGHLHKVPVLALVHRETGKSRAFVIDRTTAANIIPIVKANVDRETYILTDEAALYRHQFRDDYLGHGRVNHKAGEYVRGRIHTNTVEGYFSIFKRGMKGVYQWCAEKHLHRYVAEFDFRYSNRQALGCNDSDRADTLLKGIIGKRLTYERASAI
jgi:transposase-like protein